MQTTHLTPNERPVAMDRLAAADEQLEAVLETVDLNRDPELAEAVLSAIRSTDRARELASDRPENRRSRRTDPPAASLPRRSPH